MFYIYSQQIRKAALNRRKYGIETSNQSFFKSPLIYTAVEAIIDLNEVDHTLVDGNFLIFRQWKEELLVRQEPRSWILHFVDLIVERNVPLESKILFLLLFLKVEPEFGLRVYGQNVKFAFLVLFLLDLDMRLIMLRESHVRKPNLKVSSTN